MKKLWILLALLALAIVPALAESVHPDDLSVLTMEELQALRNAEAAYLTRINTELGKRVNAGETTGDEVLGTISELFPDPNFALKIRDGVGKFSVSQPVTQADLDKVTGLGLWDSGVTDLTGIGYLRNLKRIEAGDIDLEYFPEEMRRCTGLEYLRMVRTQMREIPEWIGELTNLTYLAFSCDGNMKGKGHITQVPDSIGNLTRLETLNLSGNQLTALPESMGNLVSLKELSLSYNKITAIPESMWTMELKTLSLTGNPIE